MADILRCWLCGADPKLRHPGVKFAIWLHGRGWLVDTCGDQAAVADRLYGGQTFPDTFTWAPGIPRNTAIRGIGNAVPPLMAEHVVRAVQEAA